MLSTTKRKVRHWGAAVEVISGFAPVGQNSASVGLQPLQWKVGLAVKAIDQKTSLTLVEISGNNIEAFTVDFAQGKILTQENISELDHEK